MAQKEPTTAWMWPDDHGGVNGATIDTIGERIHWFDSAAGCACGDSIAVQPYERFLTGGSPLGTIPSDVRDEITASIHILASR